jgi:hypothetical protein
MAILTISNGESGASARGKINAVINYVNSIALVTGITGGISIGGTLRVGNGITATIEANNAAAAGQLNFTDFQNPTYNTITLVYGTGAGDISQWRSTAAAWSFNQVLRFDTAGVAAIYCNNAGNGLTINGTNDISGVYGMFISSTGRITCGASIRTVAGNGLYATIGGVIKDFFADASNTLAAETDLYSYSVPDTTLKADGEKLLAQYAVNLTASGNTKRIRLYFGGQVIYDTDTNSITSSFSANAYNLDFKVSLIRSGAGTVRSIVEFVGTFDGTQPLFDAIQTDLAGVNFAVANILKITGQSTASNELTAKLGTIKWKPAAS